MSVGGSLTADFTVPFIGALLCVTPAITRPTVQFGVRVPGERAGTAVVQRDPLGAWTRALLTLIALVNLSLLLAALQNWQVYRLSGIGSAAPLLPFLFGMLALAAVMVRTGQGGYRLAGGGRGRGLGLAAAARGLTAVADRDDDRFWKAGLIYVNRDDPAIMVGARFGVGWTFNFANPMAWLIIGGIVAAPAGLTLILRAAAM